MAVNVKGGLNIDSLRLARMLISRLLDKLITLWISICQDQSAFMNRLARLDLVRFRGNVGRSNTWSVSVHQTQQLQD